MNKTINFLSGLPRSGNTLLSAILNQNPIFHVSPLSPLSNIFYELDKIKNINENCLRTESNQDRLESLMKNVAQFFYKDVEQNIIFDRDKTWGTPYHINLITKYINPQPKIIFTVRDINEIISSFIELRPKAFVEEYESGSFYLNYYKKFEDGFAEYLMRPNGQIDNALCSLSSFLNKRFSNFFHIVEYKDLVESPEKTINEIYKFLNIEPYGHDFLNIKKLESDNDTKIGFPEKMHKVHSAIKPSDINPKNILSEYTYNKYSDMEFWRPGSKMIESLSVRF
jgi:sulfotransferase